MSGKLEGIRNYDRQLDNRVTGKCDRCIEGSGVACGACLRISGSEWELPMMEEKSKNS